MKRHSPDRNHAASREVFVFGEFELHPDRGMLLKNGVELPLRRRCFQVLKYLILHRGVLVSKQELMDAVWCDVIVTESSLIQCILTIRRVLGDESKTLIRSIPRSGYLFDHPVTVRKTPPPDAAFIPFRLAAGRGLLPWAAAAIFALGVVFVFARYADQNVPVPVRQADEPAPLPASIAVLPFRDVSSSRDHEEVADGISENVLDALARNPNLVVIASASTFAFKGTGKDLESIAARLNVANVLEGSVLRTEGRVRVMTRLMDANAGTALWSQSYDLDANDIHVLPNEIANSVAAVLKVEQAENVPFATSQPDAMRHYLIGKHFHGRRAPGDLERAIENFRSAVEIDPGFTNAWVGLAGSLWSHAGEQPDRWTSIREEIKFALDRALELDPNNPEANARIAKYYWDVDQDKLATRYFERAMEFGQNTPQVLAFAAGFAFAQFDYDAAVEFQQRAARLDPLSFVHQVNLALFLRYAGRLDESIAAYENAFDLNPQAAIDFRQDYLVIFLLNGQYDRAEELALQLPQGPSRDHHLAMVYLALGQPSRGDGAIQRLSAETSAEAALRLAEYYAFAGDTDLSFHWLEQAGKRQGDALIHPAANTYFEVFLHSPFLQQLTHDPRWQAWREYLETRLQTPVISISTPQLVMTGQDRALR